MPHAALPTRVAEERYAFDSLGTIVESRDGLEAFWGRSLGAQAMDPAKPYQFRFATNEPFTPPDARSALLALVAPLVAPLGCLLRLER